MPLQDEEVVKPVFDQPFLVTVAYNLIRTFNSRIFKDEACPQPKMNQNQSEFEYTDPGQI